MKAELKKNTFEGTEKIQLYIDSSLPTISQNNFVNSLPNTAILLTGEASGDINASHNFWDVTSTEAVKRCIQDKRTDGYGLTNFKVIIEPIALQKFSDAYPE